MMTSVLRDSLGGNCKTVMIATVNAETVGGDRARVLMGATLRFLSSALSLQIRKESSAVRLKPGLLEAQGFNGDYEKSTPPPRSMV